MTWHLTASRTVRCAVLGLVLGGIVGACRDATSHDDRQPIERALTVRFAPTEAEPSQWVDLLIDLPTEGRRSESMHVIVEFGGLATGTDTTDFPGEALELRGMLMVPAPVPDGVITATVKVPELRAGGSATLTVRDRTPPAVEGGANASTDGPPWPSMLPGNTVFLAGATTRLVIDAEDNNGLQWIGYQLGPPWAGRESTLVSWATRHAVGEVQLDVPSALAGGTVSLSMFARDLGGQLATRTFGDVPVYRYRTDAPRSVSLESAPHSVVHDAARDRLYVSQPGLNRVAVLSLGSLAYEAPVSLPYPPAGLDLVPSGDTLLAALRGTPLVAVIDLTTVPATVDTIRLAFASRTEAWDSPYPWAERVAVAGDGRVLVTLAHPDPFGLEELDKLIELDLTSGTQRVAFSGWAVPDPVLVRTGNRQRAYVINLGTAGNAPGALRYSAATHAFTIPAGASPYSGAAPPVTTTGAGDLVLSQHDLLDGELRAVRAIGVTGYVSGRSAIAPDGQEIFTSAQFACGPFGTTDCPAQTEPAVILRYSVTGALREMIRTPEWIEALYPLVGGRTLIGVGPTQLLAIDLASTPPPVGAAVAHRSSAAMSLAPTVISADRDRREVPRAELRWQSRP
jgi:hypothetical protein